MSTRNNPRKFDESTRKWLESKCTNWYDASSKIITQCEAEANEQTKEKCTLKELIELIDLTTLNSTDTRTKVQNLVDHAIGASREDGVQTAAVCVYPIRVKDVKERLIQKPNNGIRIASVAAAFPSGMCRLESKLLEIALAIRDGADEIDIVINRSAALEGDWQTVYDEVAEMRKECGNKAHMKTILAVGELHSHELVYKASMVAMIAGSDFIKTSTGKELVNATYEYAYTMCAAIKDFYELTGIMVGFKAAGGISTPVQAQTYKNIITTLMPYEGYHTKNYFRIGASSLLDNILEEL